MSERIDHLAQPGPQHWDWRCLRCGEPCDQHVRWWHLFLRGMGYTFSFGLHRSAPLPDAVTDSEPVTPTEGEVR